MGGGAYKISLVATPALMSSSEMISLVRVGVPAKALRTKDRYLELCGNRTMERYASAYRQKSFLHTASLVTPREVQLKNVHE